MKVFLSLRRPAAHLNFKFFILPPLQLGHSKCCVGGVYYGLVIYDTVSQLVNEGMAVGGIRVPIVPVSSSRDQRKQGTKKKMSDYRQRLKNSSLPQEVTIH